MPKIETEVEKLTRQRDRLQEVLSLSHKIHSTLGVDDALRIVLDAALESTRMQRGFIMLFNENGDLEFKCARDKTGRVLTQNDFQVSRTIIDKAIERNGLYAFVNSEQESPSLSMIALKIGSGFSIPLYSHRSISKDSTSTKIIGVLYEDSKTVEAFDSYQNEIVNALASHAGLALENAALYELATLDGLTRVYQRRYFDAISAIEWKRSVRHSHPLSIVMVDLDHFKSVNDTYGHDAGDQVLKKTAELLKSNCRAGDILARYGGEEFVILLTETDPESAALCANKICEAVAGAPILPERPITASLGLASYPACAVASIQELQKLADKALYQAKHSGRNRVVVCKSR
jgi:diguanylate cyclase (GGDEF)-like protein